MNNGRTWHRRDWLRHWKTFIALLLTLTVLFNTATAFAFAAVSVPSETTATARHSHEMPSPCCPDQSPHHNNCCQGHTCTCMGDCVSLLLSQPMSVQQNLFKQAAPQLTENIPSSHFVPPPQHPPRS